MLEISSFNSQNQKNQNQTNQFKSETKLSNNNREKESQVIFRALKSAGKPLSRRQISVNTKIEISNLCRALFNQVNLRKTLRIAKYDVCQTTGKTVQHFAINKKGGRDAK